jgi:UDP-N-acetylglucosamine 2-epimerase (non-hydrolysing)
MSKTLKHEYWNSLNLKGRMVGDPFKIHLVAGARPNFMKIAPVWLELKRCDWALPQIIHTGQHYDPNMSGFFFNDLNMPGPDFHLGVGSGSHAEQTGQTLMAIEKVLRAESPDLVVVVGDVNATLAAALAAAKLCIPVAHLEAGLRSCDRSMPEEINRVLTDSLADLLWTPSQDGDENLAREGVGGQVVRVGSMMIDCLELARPKIEASQYSQSIGLNPGGYGLVTLHRPANVDHQQTLAQICNALVSISTGIPLIFPVHPRSKKMLQRFGLLSELRKVPNLRIVEPLAYLPFMNLMWNSRLVITDSGGIQQETSYLGIPCFTLRTTTELPITVSQGTNRLCNAANLEQHIQEIPHAGTKEPNPPELWDGASAGRVVASINEFLHTRAQSTGSETADCPLDWLTSGD